MSIQLDPSWLPWLMLSGLWLLFYLLWVHYLAVMNLKQSQDSLKPVARFFGYWQVLPAGLALDWLFNVLLTVPFLDPPHSLLELTSSRLQRYVSREPNSWRGRLSWSFAAEMLNDFDRPGGHIRRNGG